MGSVDSEWSQWTALQLLLPTSLHWARLRVQSLLLLLLLLACYMNRSHPIL